MKKALYKWIMVMTAFSFFVISLLSYFGIKENKTDGMAVHGEVMEAKDDRERRTEDTKVFDMGNHEYRAVCYGFPVHYMDESGEWQDIDFTLQERQENGEERFVNHDGSVSLPKTYRNSSSMILLQDRERRMSVRFLCDGKGNKGKDGVSASLKNPNTAFQTIEEAENGRFSAAIDYEEILPKTDFHYTIDAQMVKENIVVRERKEEYRFSFRIDLNDLEPVMREDGSIDLMDPKDGMAVYGIPAPLMYDEDGNISEKVGYEITRSSGNAFLLQVIADDEWINEEGRNFPVTIDPTIVHYTSTYHGNLEDTYICGDYPNNPHALTSMLWVRSNRTTFLRFNNLSIPDYAVLNYANIRSYYYFYDHINTGSVGVSAHDSSVNWNQYTWTWNEAANYTNYGVNSSVLSTDIAWASSKLANPEYMTFNVFNSMKGVLESGNQNKGFALKYIPGSANLSVIIIPKEQSQDYASRLFYGYTERIYHYQFYYDAASMQPSGGTDYTTYFENVVDAVAAVYLRDFRVKLDLNPVINEDILHTGNCPNNQAYSNGCHVGVDEGCSHPHHFNIYEISDYYMVPYQASTNLYDTITVYWTNYADGIYCDELTSGYSSLLPNQQLAGVIFNGTNNAHRPFINVYQLDKSLSYPYANCPEANMALILMHETAHVFGMTDVYNNTGHNAQGWKCVMEKHDAYYSFIAHDGIYPTLQSFYDAICDGETDAFCSSCKATLLAQVNSGLDFFRDLTTLNPIFQNGE